MHQSTRFDLKKTLGNSAPLILLALIIILALRIAFIWLMGLMPQDAYYHFYDKILRFPILIILLQLLTCCVLHRCFRGKGLCCQTHRFCDHPAHPHLVLSSL